MKNNFKTLFVASILLVTACSKEDSSQAPPDDLLVQEQEQTPLAINSVAENVIINGATKKDGTPPTPNEVISLDVSASSKTAFKNEGFDIAYKSDADVTGAYLQFKANDGTMAEGYYEINLANNKAGKMKQVNIKSLFENANPKALKVSDEDVIDIDFNADVEAGTFCVVVCVFDDTGNISAPQEYCIQVEEWGGLSNLVGTWDFTKMENTQNGVKTVINAGENFCVEYESFCATGSYTANSCTSIDEVEYVFNENGTFEAKLAGNVIDPNLAASYEQCVSVSAGETPYGSEVEGYWSYVAEDGKLILMGYSYIQIDGEYQVEEAYENGEAEVYFEGEIDLNGNSLTIEETQTVIILDEVSELHTKTFLERK